jgi:hypothetical protein
VKGYSLVHFLSLPQTTDLSILIYRFVNFDYPLAQVLKRAIRLGHKRIVISDIACKYSIHFWDRITHHDFPLLTPEEINKLWQIEIVWLVPKFHLASHIQGCAENFSFNWTDCVGRTSGESVETNWSSLNLLATATREMGFGHRRDTLNDAMLDWNWRKATGEGMLTWYLVHICAYFQQLHVY